MRFIFLEIILATQIPTSSMTGNPTVNVICEEKVPQLSETTTQQPQSNARQAQNCEEICDETKKTENQLENGIQSSEGTPSVTNKEPTEEICEEIKEQTQTPENTIQPPTEQQPGIEQQQPNQGQQPGIEQQKNCDEICKQTAQNQNSPSFTPQYQIQPPTVSMQQTPPQQQPQALPSTSFLPPQMAPPVQQPQAPPPQQQPQTPPLVQQPQALPSPSFLPPQMAPPMQQQQAPLFVQQQSPPQEIKKVVNPPVECETKSEELTKPIEPVKPIEPTKTTTEDKPKEEEEKPFGDISEECEPIKEVAQEEKPKIEAPPVTPQPDPIAQMNNLINQSINVAQNYVLPNIEQITQQAQQIKKQQEEQAQAMQEQARQEEMIRQTEEKARQEEEKRTAEEAKSNSSPLHCVVQGNKNYSSFNCYTDPQEIIKALLGLGYQADANGKIAVTAIRDNKQVKLCYNANQSNPSSSVS